MNDIMAVFNLNKIKLRQGKKQKYLTVIPSILCKKPIRSESNRTKKG